MAVKKRCEIKRHPAHTGDACLICEKEDLRFVVAVGGAAVGFILGFIFAAILFLS